MHKRPKRREHAPPLQQLVPWKLKCLKTVVANTT